MTECEQTTIRLPEESLEKLKREADRLEIIYKNRQAIRIHKN